MEVETQAGSGQDTGNTGAASTPVNSLSDAVSAAIKATESKSTEKAESPPSVDKTAGDKPGGEDASPASDKEPDKPTTEKAEAEAPKADAPKFEAPKHWPEADRKAFAELPETGQALIKRLSKDLEGGFTRKSQELGDKVRYADTVRGLIDDGTRQQMQASGVNEVQYFQYLDSLQKFASRDGPGYVKWAMRSLGVTPEQLGIHAPAQQQPAGSQHEQSIADLLVDPEVKQLKAELAALKGQQLTPEAVRQQTQEYLGQVAEQQQLRFIRGTAQQFRGAQDDSGQLLYPHFDTVSRQMGALMDTDPELAAMPDGPEKMAKAYDMAVYARPDLRQSFIEAETQKRLAAEERKREAARAKSITSVKPAVGVATQSVKPKTLDEIVRENIANVTR